MSSLFMINNVYIEGEVSGEPRIFAKDEETSEPTVAQVQIKILKKGKDGKDYSSWITIKGYGKHAQLVVDLEECDHVVISGQLMQESWKSKTGQKLSHTIVEPYKILLVNNAKSGTLSGNEDQSPDGSEGFQSEDF